MFATAKTMGWIAGSCFLTELLGYLLHRLLHSDKVRFLSRGHMMHHLVLYGPLQPQRPEGEYQDATTGQMALANVGLEWLIPSGLILGAALTIFHFLRVEWLYRAIFVTCSLGWGFLMFSYLHDRMHVHGFWMERTVFLRRWFVNARRLHDIHHWTLNDQGLMDKNFGIGFFLFDRLFLTFQSEGEGFNNQGYAAAARRYGLILNSQEPRVGIE